MTHQIDRQSGVADVLARFPAKLVSGEAEQNIHIRNLSCGGARVEGAQDLTVGEIVTLESEPTGPVRAHVAWNISGDYGLIFIEEELEQSEWWLLGEPHTQPTLLTPDID